MAAQRQGGQGGRQYRGGDQGGAERRSGGEDRPQRGAADERQREQGVKSVAAIFRGVGVGVVPRGEEGVVGLGLGAGSHH